LYKEELNELRAVVLNYDLALGERLDAWTAWCRLFDEQEAADEGERAACKEYSL